MVGRTLLSHITLLTKVRKNVFETLMKILQPHCRGTVLMGGDTNTSFNLSLDKSPRGPLKLKRPPKQSLKFAQLLNTYGLIDIWREHNPHTRDYNLPAICNNPASDFLLNP